MSKQRVHKCFISNIVLNNCLINVTVYKKVCLTDIDDQEQYIRSYNIHERLSDVLQISISIVLYKDLNPGERLFINISGLI